MAPIAEPSGEQQLKIKLNELFRMNMEEKRRRLKKEGRSLYIEEDDPVKFKLAVNILTMKLFADQERK